MLFNWLRIAVRNAVLLGVDDAVQRLTRDDANGTPVLEVKLMQGQQQLAPPIEEATHPTGRKAKSGVKD
jgi:hypothetical protein